MHVETNVIVGTENKQRNVKRDIKLTLYSMIILIIPSLSSPCFPLNEYQSSTTSPAITSSLTIIKPQATLSSGENEHYSM